ncbi:RelA/SpoT domain-containing protein [Photobacterium leiognathi]|uniref:RelA/SpoT domain-containing protein n=1 Tax=Photobacterium leiognathi TaxID=553611 RepID=UPI0029811E40|nr:RelA/SpoT domain-containing protein [Photobacterium leiognathi]
MANKQYESQKVTLKYSKNAIDKAARLIRHKCTDDERVDAIDKIQNFREIHAYPLMLMKNHLVRTSNKVSTDIVVARRLKRLPTIINKLERPTLDGQSSNSIKITRMQDIGGCRAIVKNIKELKELQARLEKSRSVHKIVNISDYLNPKPSGYGGVHLIYSCFNNSEDGHNWKKTKIEVQLRTKLQHAWATCLEIIDTLECIELKTSMHGHPLWREFFSIAGQLVAHQQKAHILDNQDLKDKQTRLRELENELDVIAKLHNFTIAMNAASKKLTKYKSLKNIGMCLVHITIDDLNKAKIHESGNYLVPVNVKIYEEKDTSSALADLNELEKSGDTRLCVLLAAKNVNTLKKAYPNYFGSTTDFRQFINKQIK